MDKDAIFTLLGGLGIFLFGITFMGEGLKKAAGNKLRDIINKFTSTPFKGILVGIILTGLLQSSSGSTALTIGLVVAGLMTFKQAIGVMFGANIGTTITAFLIGAKVSDYAFPIIMVGAFGFMFITSSRKKAVAQSILGFGLLFLGMSLMGDALKPMAKEQWFTDLLMKSGTNPLLGMFTAAGLTIVVQSSSASIGIAQELVNSIDGFGLKEALPLALGANIGTTITAVLAAIGATKAAKRTASVHVLFNLIAGLVALVFIVPFTTFTLWLTDITGAGDVMGVAFGHAIFNIVFVLIFMWFIPLFEKFAYMLFPKDSSEHIDQLDLNYNLITEAPALALEDAKTSVAGMTKLTLRQLNHTYAYLKTNSVEELKTALQLEVAVDATFAKVQKYLRKLSGAPMTDVQSKEFQALIMSSKDIERIGDYAVNLTEEFGIFLGAKIKMSSDAWDRLKEGFKHIIAMTEELVVLLQTYSTDVALKIRKLEQELDDMEETARAEHVVRIANNTCVSPDKVNYQKMWSDIERIGDHINNVGRYFRPKSKMGSKNIELTQEIGRVL